MDYQRAMTALRRRRLWIVVAVLGCTILTGLGSTRMKRQFLASATLMPQEQALESLTEIQQSQQPGAERVDLVARQDRLKTVATVLNSPAVLGTVIDRLNLSTLTPAKLQESIEVKEITSQLVRVNVTHEDQKLAASIVNAIVDTFVSFYANLRSQEARKQLETLARDRERADAELQSASSRLERFKKSNDIVSVADQAKADLDRANELARERNTAEARLRDVSAQIDTTAQVLGRTAATREIRESASQTLLVDKLRLDVAEIKRSLEKELAVHTEEHANVKRLKQELGDAERRLESEGSKMATSVKVIPNPDRELLQTKVRELRNERDGLIARVASLNRELAKTQAQALSYSGKDVEMSLLQQRYTMAEQRLTSIDARLMQLSNAASMLTTGTPIAIVDRAGPKNPPLDLAVGRTLKLTVLAFVMSLAMCIAMAIGLEAADKRIRTVEDAERMMELPVASVVPALRGRMSDATLCLTAEDDPSSHLAESYHFLANHILRQTLRRESTVIMGATARPGQGATTALCNTAIALARAGRKVVLVDADLRRPSLHMIFPNDQRTGLTDVLRGWVTPTDALIGTHVENLMLLQAGSAAKDPWSLLWQPSMGTLVQELREIADYVVFNVPSATVFADALCVAPHVDGAVMVIKTCEMANAAERKVRDWLEEVNVPVMGVVLNGVPTGEMENYEFHRSYTSRKVQPAPALGPGVQAAPLRKAA